MYYVFIKNNQIVGSGQAKRIDDGVICIEITKDEFDNISNYVWDGEKLIIDENFTAKKREVKKVREQYFAEHVDFYQSKPLMWEELDETLKQDIADYRKYLMDYTKEENWWEKNPLNFEEWKNVNLA